MSNYSLIDTFTAIALRNRDRTALSTPDVSHTFGDLMRLASQTARHFEAQGIGPGDRVAIALRRADDTVIAMLGCWMAGATGMAIDFRTKPAEKALLSDTFGLRAVIEPRPAPGSQGYVSVAIGENLADTVASGDPSFAIRPAEVHPAIIMRTSGTTGTPVGVVFNHDTLLRLHWTMGHGSLRSNRGLYVHALPLFYSAGIARTISHLLDESPVHILPSISSAEEIAETILSLSARQLSVVPPQLLGMLELSAGRTTPMFPGLDALTGAGAKFPADTIIRAYNELSNGLMISYGASFGGSISTLMGPDILRKPESVGKVDGFNHIRITDFDGNAVAQGEPGIIRVRSPTIADAVLGEARALSDRMIDGWAVPGDLGYLDDEGFLTLTGRASDMIIRKGVNVYPREIEAVLESRADVTEAAAIGYSHGESGEEIAVFVVAGPGVTVEMLAGHVQANIVADKRPRDIRIVERLPRNDAGKVLKRVLVEMMEADASEAPPA